MQNRRSSSSAPGQSMNPLHKSRSGMQRYRPFASGLGQATFSGSPFSLTGQSVEHFFDEKKGLIWFEINNCITFLQEKNVESSLRGTQVVNSWAGNQDQLDQSKVAQSDLPTNKQFFLVLWPASGHQSGTKLGQSDNAFHTCFFFIFNFFSFYSVCFHKRLIISWMKNLIRVL